MSKDKKLELYDLEAIQITDKKHAEDILKELLEEEFAMSYSMVLFKVELVELTNKKYNGETWTCNLFLHDLIVTWLRENNHDSDIVNTEYANDSEEFVEILKD